MNRIDILALGADPEVFLVNRKGKGHSAEGLFGGTKQDPKPMEDLPPGFFIQEDNVSAEYNVPPTSNIREWAQNLQEGLSYIRRVARKRGLTVKLAPDMDFPIRQLLTPQALELGCEPDFNAWTQSKNPRPKPPQLMRTAAAHIHISWAHPSDEQRWNFVKALDLFVGVPSVVATPPNRRRELYGRAGACRLKPYGVEYRVPDNFYLESQAKSMKVGQAVASAAMHINGNPLFMQHINDLGEDIQRIINTHNQEDAKQMMEYFHLRGF